jgi:hypothetical protein
MADNGFDYPLSTSSDAVADAPLYLSPSELRRSGYQYDWAAAAEQFLELNGPEGPPDPTEGMTTNEANAYAEALGGSSPGATVILEDPDGGTRAMDTEGCAADARTQLYDSVANAMRFDRAVEMLGHSGLRNKLQSIDAYEEPMTRWQRCMREAGYDVTDAHDYGLQFLQSRGAAALSDTGLDQTDVTAEMITDVANTDADCQESSGLYEVRQELLPEIQDEVAAELGFEMSQYIAFQHAVLERAQQVP